MTIRLRDLRTVTNVKKRCFAVLTVTLLASIFACSTPVSGIAKQSTLTMTVDNDTLPISITPTPDGVFEKSANNTVTVWTDNFTGYTLSVASSGSTSAVNSNEDEIQSLGSSIDESAFSSSSTYNNRLGFKPNQYITTSGGINTVVQNSDYLPTPATTGELLAVTSGANVSSDSYTMAFGARVDTTLPAGSYTYTYVLTAVANAIVYNVTYDDNTSETVTSMPSPNPQALTIPGGTLEINSYAPLSDAVPVMTTNNMNFGGWCDVATTIDSETGNYVCSGNTYDAGDGYPIDQTSSATNITLYAIWLMDPFPMVWSQMGACEFHAATDGNITGTECQKYANDKFIDTGIALYNNANYQKDYEVHFTIDHYVPSENDGLPDGQQTFVTDKLSQDVTSSPYDGKGPGMIVRRSGDNIQIRSTYGHSNSDSNNSSELIVPSGTTTDISIYRISNVIYASINHGALIRIQSISNFDQQFGLNTWFGAYPSDDCTGNNTGGICTNAKRYIEATFSNMYIKLGDFDETSLHHITFNGNGGTPASTTYAVIDGDVLGTLPTATRTDYVLMYWYTTSGGSSIATPETQPHGDATYYAFWLKEAAQAQISNSSIVLPLNGTETINVTNSAELEDYTFSSSNDTVATVDSTTGLVTGVGIGTTTITMTGTHSGTTKTINVTVSDSMARVTFNAGQGSSIDPMDVEYGSTINELPISIRSGYTLEGWYTGADGTGTKLTTSLPINDNMTFIANWIVTTNVCRLADPTQLHEETCTGGRSNGCRTSGVYAQNEKITYGTVPVDSTLSPGIAYTCDINANNEYDEETERFYYLGTNNGNAVLVWYKNISDVSINYDAAYDLLPDSTMWRNTNLIAQANDKVARYMRVSEVTAACGGNTNGLKTRTCVYLMEKSNYANTNMIDGIWVEKISNATNGGRRIHTTGLTLGNVNPNTGGSNNAPRPVIEIPMNMLEIWSSGDYTITFNPHNETASWDETVSRGDALGNAYPANDPTYTNHIFQGWYTEASGGTLVTSSTKPSGSTTYHAQWKGTVALATVANNNISVAANETATVSVTNAVDLEGFSFSSSNTNVATIDSSTGVINPVAEGTTNISITGTSSNTTNQIATVTVTQAAAQYTIYFNPHNGSANSSATVTAGSEIGSNNIPEDPTNTDPDQIFMGWFTAASGGDPVDEFTVPSADGETYHAQYKKIVCKLETSDANLHTATRALDSTLVTYGQIANNTTPQAGDAYNCDIDYDGTYNAVNERFYYLGTDTDNNSALVAWNSYYNGTWAPGVSGNSGDTIYTYTDALSQLPANINGAWDNPGIIEQETEKAARFTTRAETISACGNIDVTQNGALVACDFLMEHSAYDNAGRSALWLMKEASTQYRIHSGNGNRHVSTSSSGSSMVRPTIVVPYKLIEKFVSALDVTNAVIANNDLTVQVGQQMTIQVSNSASLEPYTFSSDDTSIATVNSSTGVVTGVSAGTVDIIMTGTTSSLTKTIEIRVESDPDTPVTFDVSNDATRGYQALSSRWAQSPVNIATFNKDTTTINNSTWGDTSELSELQYWQAIRTNFIDNECYIKSNSSYNTNSDATKPLSALSAWTSGNVDCSKPDAYDTNTNSALTVRLNDNQGTVVTYAKADNGVIHNMIPGQTYYWEKTSDSSVYGYVTAVSNGSSTGTRWVDMDVVRNARDIGGLPVTYTDSHDQTVTGTLAYGRIFRGEKLQNVDASELTNLGITTEYNVGDEYSGDTHLTDYQPFNVIHYNFDYNSGDEGNPNSNYMKAWNAVTSIMTDITNTQTTKNVYIHCRVGADRTGTIIYLLEGLLGVPNEQRYEEYGLSNLSGLYDRTRYYKEKIGGSTDPTKKFVYMMGYVQTNQNIYDWYMQNPNADANLIQAFRTAMVIADAPQNNQQNQQSPQNQQNQQSPNRSLSTEDSDSSEDKSETKDGSENYAEPLGVSDTVNNESYSPSATEIIVAVASTVAAGAAAFVLGNDANREEEQ